MSGMAGVITAADGTTATLEIPAADPITAAIPSNLTTIAVAGVQAIVEWQNPSDPDAQGNWIITQAGGVPGVIARDGLDPAVQSDIATGVQASGKADTAQAAAQAAQQTADAAKTAAATASSQAGAAQGAAGTAQTTADNAAAAAASAAGIAGGKADVLIQSTAPAAAMQKATTLWIDTSNSGNIPKRWSGTAWVAVTDKTATDAAAAASSAATAAATAQSTANAAQSNANAAAQAAAAAQTSADTAQTTASNAATAAATAQSTANTAKSDAAAASSAAASAAGIAGGKADVLIQSTTPASTMQKFTTLWIDTTSSANTPKRWSGSAWVAVTDKAATDAANAAANAASAAAAAQSTADTAKTNAATAQAAANAAKSAADAAAAQAGQALSVANGKNVAVHSTAAPSSNGYAAGDVWYRHNGSMAGPVDGQWHWDGSKWIADQITDAIISSITAGKISGGVLEGLDGFYSPSATALPRIHMGGSQLEIVRPVLGPDGTATGAAQTTTVLGGQNADQLAFFDATGNVKGGFDAAGKMTAESVLTGALSLAGTDIMDIVQAAPQGPIVGHRFTANTTGYTDAAEHDTVDLFFTAEPGRAYRVVVDGAVRASDATFPQVTFRYTSTTDGTKPPRPTLLSPVMKLTRVTGPTAGLSSMGLHMEYVFNIPASGVETAYRVLLTVTSANTTPAYLYAGTTFFVEDFGSSYTGIWADGNTTDDIVKTVEEIISYNINTATWIDGSLEVRPGDHNHWMKQGYNWNNSGNWGHQCYTNEWIPQAVRDSLSGAQTITSIELGMSPTLVPFSNDGFVPRIAKSAAAWNNGAPSASVPSASEAFDGTRIPAGGTAWQKLPTGWYADIATGAITSLQFGTQAGQATKYAGDFGYTGPLNGQTGKWGICPIRIRYTKSVTS